MLGRLKQLRRSQTQIGGREGERNGGTCYVERSCCSYGRESIKCCHEHIYGADGGENCLQHNGERRERQVAASHCRLRPEEVPRIHLLPCID